MKQEEITEGNKIIANFMGYYIKEESIQIRGGRMTHKVLYDKDGFTTNFYLDRIRTYEATEDELYLDLRFHKSWKKLMPVVEKIELIKDPYHGHFGVHIVSNSCSIQSTNFRPDKRIPDPPHYAKYITGKDKIEATWLAVVEFIKWFNTQ
jgi:hypothetical protein